MAMNKKEKEEMEELKTKLALRFTGKVDFDIETPVCGASYSNRNTVNGYSFNAYSKRVVKSCSSFMSHNNGGWNKTTSQQPIKQFSSELLAYKAMRHEMELIYAKELREVDIKIEAVEQGGTYIERT